MSTTVEMMRANLLADYYERAFQRYCSLRDADEVSSVAQSDALAHYERGEDKLAELAKSAGLRAIGWHDAIAHLPR